MVIKSNVSEEVTIYTQSSSLFTFSAFAVILLILLMWVLVMEVDVAWGCCGRF